MSDVNDVRRDYRGLWTAIGGFVVAKLLFVVLLATRGEDLQRSLIRFDAGWYLKVLVEGYHYRPGERSDLAFFPLLPGLAKVGTFIGLPPGLSLLLVALAGSGAAVVGIWFVGRHVATPAVGTWLALLWSVAPRAHVQAMAYSEGLFTAAVAFSLLGVLSKRWWLAGCMGLVAGLTRPTAAALIGTLALVWVADVVRRWRAGERGPRTVVTPQLAATLLAAAGLVGYTAYVAVVTGSPTGYFRIQKDWNQHLGTPVETVQAYVRVIGEGGALAPLYLSVGVVVIGYIVALACMFITREPWPLIAYAGLSVALVLSQQNYYYASARFLLPAFVVLLPPARWLAKGRPWLTIGAWIVALIGSTVWSVHVATGSISP